MIATNVTLNGTTVLFRSTLAAFKVLGFMTIPRSQLIALRKELSESGSFTINRGKDTFVFAAA